MSKRLVILFCVLVALAFAVPAFAAVQNIKVSGDILARYISRTDFDLVKDSAGSDDHINVFNSVVRLRVDADLTDNVSTVVRLINERNWNYADAASTDIDLDLAYVTLKEFLYSPLTLTIGRQEIHFGNDMIMGDGVGKPRPGIVAGAVGTNQTTNYTEASGYGGRNGDLALRKSFDAIRATLNYDPLVLDVILAKFAENVLTGGATNDDGDLYGINAGYKFGDPWNTFGEAYIWSKRNKGTTAGALDSNNNVGSWTKGKGDDLQTVGIRASMTPTKKLNIQQELAYQFGERVNPSTGTKRDRSAWASQTVVMYTPGWKYDPTTGLIYSYFSGEADTGTTDTSERKWHGWDPMFENQTNGHIINALFPSTNAHNIDLMVKLTPMEDVTLQADYIYLLLARGRITSGAIGLSEYDGSTASSGGNVFKAHKTSLGQEFDINLLYDYTEDVQFGLLAGWFWPGTAYEKYQSGTTTKQRVTASEFIASCNVKF